MYRYLLAILIFCMPHAAVASMQSAKKPDPQRKEFKVITPDHLEAYGMFAVFNLILGHLHLFDTGQYANVQGLKVDFGYEGNYYDPMHGPNWWQYYFEPLTVGSSKATNVRLFSPDENQHAWAIRRNLTRQDAFRLIDKYVRVRKTILEKVKKFSELYFKDCFMIGVHYRGTDKAAEAPRVPYDEVIRVVGENLAMLGDQKSKIFVATDEQAFLNYIQKAFPNQVIAINAFRSSNTNNLHHTTNHPYEQGKQAIIDALLLANCQLLIRTSSNLSLWSSYYNPDLPVIMLNHRYHITE